MLRTIETFNRPDLTPIADPSRVSGFQSPADDYKEQRLNIMEKLVRDPLNTYFFESDSDAMEAFDIREGTILVVDRTLAAKGGNIVIAWIDGTWLVRQLRDINGKRDLITGMRDETPIVIAGDEGIMIWGVVTWSCSPQIEKNVCTSRL
ncbi:S24 family peptidase [Daejeonella sp.]|uniref:S24 family peptidase n=1 Tax=Daejeonella sp. TaxID=2805397 RepID=UPI003982F1F6